MMNILGKFMSVMALLFLSLTMAANDTTAVSEPKKPKGFDAGQYVGAGRRRSPANTQFISDSFKDNFSFGFFGDTRVPLSPDYGFSYSAGFSFMKWLTPSSGIRFDAMGGYVISNLTGQRMPQVYVGTSALFNVTSYISGYDKRRFCEVSTVMGIGYSCWWDLMTTHYFTGNVGANINLRLTDRLSVYVEPYMPLNLGLGGLDYGFATRIGAYCDFSTQVYRPTIAGKYYLSFSAGLQAQSSELVKIARDKTYNTTGMSFMLGVGRRFEDYFSVRFSAVYSRHTWTVYYGGKKMPANYFSFTVEGVFDALRMIMNKCGKENFPVGCGIALGPEAGCFFKRDLDENLSKHYVGLTGALHIDCRLGRGVSIFMEPRMRILPYSAPHDVSTANNVNRNYYDGLFNFSVGLEVDL